MALPLANTGAGGTNGAVVTSGSGGNTGGASGDHFNTVVGNVTFSNEHPGFGTLGYKCNQAVAGQAKVAWATAQVGTVAEGETVYTRHYFYATANPTPNTLILQARSSAGNAYSVRWNTDGKIQLLDATSTPVATSVGALPLNEMIRIETKALVSATVGRLVARAYYDDGSGKSHHGTTEVFSLGSEVTDQNTRGSVYEMNFGLMTSGTGNTVWIDEMVMSTADWVGSANPPTSDPADVYKASGGAWVPGWRVLDATGGTWS